MTTAASGRPFGVRIRIVVLCLIPVLSGCASWSKHGIEARSPRKIRVIVLPTRLAVSIKHLKDIRSVPKSEMPPPDEKGLIQQEMRQAANNVSGDISAKLGASYFFEVVSDTDARKAMEASGLAASTAALTAAQVENLGRAVGAQAVLMTQLSGYGAIKKRWLFYLIGSGLIEGLAQGAVVAAAISSPWVAVGIGAEEAAQETAEWGGGALLFGKIYSPVIIEGQLTSVADGRVVWSGTELASSNRKAVRTLPKEDRDKREIRLRLTAQRAAADLVKSLDKKAWSNLKDADEREIQPQAKMP